MKKKISITQAIMGEPKLVFLDEPTSGVDPESNLRWQKLFAQMNKSGICITFNSDNEIEKIVSNLVEHKIGIRSVMPQKATLEEIFLN